MAAFKKIYEEYAQPVYRFLLSLTGSEDMAEELLSETFFNAFIHIDKFEGRCSLYTWLCQIGKNAWIKEYRRSKKYSETRFEDLDLADKTPSVEDQIISKEMYEKIHYALEKIGEPYRDVFILHAMGEIKLTEIASIYEKTESWARVTYFRAKQQIAKELSK